MRLNKNLIHMKYYFFRFILLSIFFVPLLAQAYFIKDGKSFDIQLDTRKGESTAAFSFADYDIKAPAVCSEPNVFCHEHTVIHSKLEKEWEVVEVPEISDKSLSAQQFATYYPDLDETKKISDGSPTSTKWIAQRILYERGLLSAFPTGKIGLQTEEAIIKLQHYKNIVEYDKNLKVTIIGPKTIKELNKLKAKMKDPNFASKSPLPNIPFKDFDPVHQERLLAMDKKYQQLAKQPPQKSETSNPNLSIVKPKNSGNVLKLFGEAKIQAKDE